jgi:hypothetical protein
MSCSIPMQQDGTEAHTELSTDRPSAGRSGRSRPFNGPRGAGWDRNFAFGSKVNGQSSLSGFPWVRPTAQY